MEDDQPCDMLKHDWDEGYYGYTCKKCKVFIPYGSEPWVDYSELDKERGLDIQD